MVTAMVGDEGDDVDRSEDDKTRGKEFRKTVAAQQARNRRTDKHTEIRREEMGLLLPDLLDGPDTGVFIRMDKDSMTQDILRAKDE